MQRYTIKDARAMTRDFVADHQPLRDVQQHRRSQQFMHAVVHIIVTWRQYRGNCNALYFKVL